MPLAISAADANRNFSTMLRQVRSGRSYTVTAHGRPVARILPITTERGVTVAARTSLFRRLRAAKVQAVGAWTRDSLYGDR